MRGEFQAFSSNLFVWNRSNTGKYATHICDNMSISHPWPCCFCGIDIAIILGGTISCPLTYAFKWIFHIYIYIYIHIHVECYICLFYSTYLYYYMNDDVHIGTIVLYIYTVYTYRICGVPTCLPFIAPASLAACFSLWGHICESLLGQSLLGTLGDCSTFLGFFGPRTFQDSSTSTFWVDGLIHDL